tara:strand:+ start:516 stop:953 length:438 start_codon:yes stop_codon:yes gene_type:complete
MAFIDSSKKPFINDREESVFMGIDLPFRKSNGDDGWFASTSSTIKAVKENIKLFLMTERGERLMQPNLGIGIRKYLFQPITGDIEVQLHNEILSSLSFWMPFVEVKELNIREGEQVGENGFKIFISFNIKKDPNTFESVQVSIEK